MHKLSHLRRRGLPADAIGEISEDEEEPTTRKEVDLSDDEDEYHSGFEANSSSDEDSDINSENSQSDFENEDKNSLNLKHSSNPVGSNNNGHNEEASNKTILTKNRKNSNSNLQNNCLDTDEIHKTDSNIVDDESEHDNNHNQSTKTTQTRQDYRKKLAEDPSYVPKFGYFWGHDDRFVKEEAENLQDNNNKFRKFPSRNKGGFKNPPTENQWGHDGYEELIRKSSLDHHNTNNHRPNSSNQYHNNSRHHNNNYHYDDNYHHNNNYYYDDNYYYDNNYRHDNHHNYSNNYRHDNNYYHRYDNNHRHNNNYRHANGNNYNHKNKSASYDEDFNDDDVVKKKEPLQNDISPLKDEAVEKKDAINELEIASNEEDAPEITTCIHQEKEIDNVEQKEMKNTNMKSIESKNNASTQPVEPSTTSTASSSKRYSSRRDTEIVTHKHQQSSNGKMDKKKMWSLDDFELGALLGSGRYGKVYKANEKLSGKTVAIKLLYKKEIRDAKMEDQLRREVEIQVSLRHPNILRLYGYFFDEKHVCLILEFAEKGELYNSLKKYGKFPERKAARYVSQISDALIYLQKNHIIHRDMKPENILLAADGRIKISDFGWAVQHTNPDVRRQTFCGTLDYMAPEMIRTKEGYDLKVDSWALGVLCYEFLIGAPPFADSPNTYETFERIVRVDFQFPDELSPEAKDLISSLLCRDPKQRIPLEDVSKHPWIVKNLKYLKSLS
ncbi:22708_t:CDS:10 [Entrophospora sp. SA101]|nr:22708_t:CDS:10 [Entrophospora sp. SA101]CAJ0901743.1 6526_t:CDS:10 [Entrophospora sp. SA101]